MTEGIRLTWQDNTMDNDGQRVYRSTSTIDTQNPPSPLDDIGPNLESYDDVTVSGTGLYHYIVSTYDSTEELFSDEIQVFYGDAPPFLATHLQDQTIWEDQADSAKIWDDFGEDISGSGGYIEKYDNGLGGYGLDMHLTDSSDDDAEDRRYGIRFVIDLTNIDSLVAMYDGGYIGATPYVAIDIDGSEVFSDGNAPSSDETIDVSGLSGECTIDFFTGDDGTSSGHYHLMKGFYLVEAG